jgi:hypothetical protein
LASRKNHLAIQQFTLPNIGDKSHDLLTKRRNKNERAKASGGDSSERKTNKILVLPSPDFFCRLAPPTPTPVFATYWKFARARQEAFFARLTGRHPELADTIIQQHRFTNAYRASDRVSQYLIRHVLYDAARSPADLVFRLLVFKFFNKIDTWETLLRSVGNISWGTYDFNRYDDCLSSIMASGQRIYSAAYIMPSGRTAFGYERKHRNHLKIIETMVAARLAERVAECKTFEAVFRLLREYPCVGPFIGYQLAIDLNYSTLLNFSEDDFVEPGPGALDGIAKCFSNLGDFAPADVIRYMTDIQERAFEQYAPGFQALWGRRLHLIDCQNLFCEVGKYARVAHPEFGGLSSRTRIKQLYRPSQRAHELPWFPPKWGINELIASDRRIQA